MRFTKIFDIFSLTSKRYSLAIPRLQKIENLATIKLLRSLRVRGQGEHEKGGGDLMSWGPNNSYIHLLLTLFDNSTLVPHSHQSLNMFKLFS